MLKKNKYSMGLVLVLLKDYYLGTLLVLALSLLSIFISNLSFIKNINFSSLTIAIIVGILYGNSFHKFASNKFAKGIVFSQKKILRLGIILYGFKITFQQIINVGVKALILDVCVVILILLIGYFVGAKILKLSKKLTCLIASGSAICGAAAVLSIESTIKPKNHETTIAIATVVIFGTIAMFLFPYIVQTISNDNYYMGLALGSTIHEVAQVVAAGNMINSEVTAIAIVVKLTRVMLLILVILVLGYLFSRKLKSTHDVNYESENIKKNSLLSFFPWFMIGFIIASAINSVNILSVQSVENINIFDNLLLTMAMAALGIETSFKKIKEVGVKPFILAFILMIALISFLFIIPQVL